ncbi:unnamed protein product [Hermetia illucens]|uniref:Uncharacterized protein n=1 Tax=Hermetia illucens TaxID=343691 RepID=A0A7R8UDJ8_HERIL|nr:unnamed protein product [Hermetia illucens]
MLTDLAKTADDVELAHFPQKQLKIKDILLDEVTAGALENLAEFIIKKCQIEGETIQMGAHSSTYIWVDEQSEGGLKKPN